LKLKSFTTYHVTLATDQHAARLGLVVGEDSVDQSNGQRAEGSDSVGLNVLVTEEDTISGHNTAARHAASTLHVAHLQTDRQTHVTTLHPPPTCHYYYYYYYIRLAAFFPGQPG